MPRINLLPWRDMERAERKQTLLISLGGAAIAAALVSAAGYLLYGSWISSQEARNEHLKGEIKIVEKQIQQIEDLEQQKQRFIARMQIIDKLQRSRPEVVHLFDQLVHVMPDGVYLTSVKEVASGRAGGKSGTKLKLEGISQSTTRVSTLMRNISASQWLQNPVLVVIENKAGSALGNSFQMEADVVSLSDNSADSTTTTKAHHGAAGAGQ